MPRELARLRDSAQNLVPASLLVRQHEWFVDKSLAMEQERHPRDYNSRENNRKPILLKAARSK